MQINLISKSNQTKGFNTFTGNEISKGNKKPTRYKHYEQMSDEHLMMHSVVKAHKQVENSNKMRLFKSMPAITTALVGTSIALAQPGTLAAEAGRGLGFVVATKAADVVMDFSTKEFPKTKKHDNINNNKKEKPIKKALAITGALLATSVATLGIVAIKKNSKTINSTLSKTGEFLTSELTKLKDEINATKLGKYIDKTVTPFLEKHPKLTSALSFQIPLGTILAGSLATSKLYSSLSNDVKKNASKNFIKGKLVQEIARKEFDSIDAKEV